MSTDRNAAFLPGPLHADLPDDARPAWLDMATLRYERTDGWFGGLILGWFAACLVTLFIVLVLW